MRWRLPKDGERCTCGKPAAWVWLTEQGEVPNCNEGGFPLPPAEALNPEPVG